MKQVPDIRYHFFVRLVGICMEKKCYERSYRKYKTKKKSRRERRRGRKKKEEEEEKKTTITNIPRSEGEGKMASCSGDRETVNRLADGIWWARKGRNPPSVTMRRPIMKPPPHISLSRSALLLLFHPLLWLLLSIRLNRSVVDLIVSSSRHLFSLSLSFLSLFCFTI